MQEFSEAAGVQGEATMGARLRCAESRAPQLFASGDAFSPRFASAESHSSPTKHVAHFLLI